MNQLKLATMSSAIALMACFAAFETAEAQIIYGTGASLPAKVYRDLWDCYGVPVVGGGAPGICAGGVGQLITPAAQGIYGSTGSGAGITNFLAQADTAGTKSTTPQFTSAFSSFTTFPAYHFSGSDDVLTSTNQNSYNTNRRATLGANLQVPAVIAPVTIAFRGTDGTGANLNIQAANPTPIVNYDVAGNPILDSGNYTKLNLSRQAICGIFSGHITQWNNPILTALNNGVVLGTGTITVVNRSDGSGTTFLAANALISQCAAITGPNHETDPTVVSYRFPWGAVVATCPTPAAVGANSINWPGFLTAASNGCAPVANPFTVAGIGTNPNGTATFARFNGSQGVRNGILATNGSIGYLSPDFARPFDAAGPFAANVGDGVGDVPGPTGYFLAPTPQLATLSISSTNPPTRNALTQPLAWSRQGVVPNPDVGTYPLVGYSWFNLYQCYAPSTLSVMLNYLQFHYTNATAATVIGNAGFAPVSGAWFSSLAQLIVTSTSQMKVGPSAVATTCSGNAG